jgi:hypothetical protein
MVWGICFSLKAKPRDLKAVRSGTVLVQLGLQTANVIQGMNWSVGVFNFSCATMLARNALFVALGRFEGQRRQSADEEDFNF